MIEVVIDDLPEDLGISPLQRHRKNTRFGGLRITINVDRVKYCLQVMRNV